nr:MarR family transcriptional regulator [uncultured Halomonas sp.]
MSDASLSESLHQLLHAYKRALRQAYREADMALTMSHMRTLKGVQRIPDCTAQAIASRTHRDKAQITRLIKDLLDAGLIAKQPHPDDRRSQILRLTVDGEHLVTQLRAVESTAATRMVKGLAPDEIEHFVKLARLMAANLTH